MTEEEYKSRHKDHANEIKMVDAEIDRLLSKVRALDARRREVSELQSALTIEYFVPKAVKDSGEVPGMVAFL